MSRSAERVDAITIGVDVGQRQDPSAIVVTELLEGDRHRIRHIERLALQTRYPQVAERLAAVYSGVVEQRMQTLYGIELADKGALPENRNSMAALEHEARQSVYVLVDATGCGLPVVDFLRETAGIEPGHLTAVMFTAGSGINVRRGAKEGTVSKNHLISRLKSLMGFKRLTWPNTPAGRELADELEDFELSINENATMQWNARAGSHDDLVCAAALSVLLGETPRVGSFKYA